MTDVNFDFSGKTVLIYGGTTGIGRETAKAFAKAKAKVFVTGIGEKDGKSLVEEMKKAGNSDVEYMEADVTKEADIKSALDKAIARFGRIHIAFNNAGISGPAGPIQDMSEKTFDMMINVNLKGIFLGMRHQIPHMLEHGGGCIVNTSSLFSELAFPSTAVYCATKYAVAGMTRSAAFEVARFGIRINSLAPGPVNTALLHEMFGSEQKAKEIVTRFVPAKRISHPAEQALVVLWLCSDAASFVVGHNVRVDGGGFEASAIDMD
jgi:NAD(P)-dependent dehydrogenase (short-subunit alcohol dehydrogenase family)